MRWPGQTNDFRHAEQVFGEIIDDGFIRPTFAPIRSKSIGITSNNVRGPEPAVCLTEQPLSAVLVTRRLANDRYSGFGIAYHKYAFFNQDGCPVLYGSKSMLGRKLNPDEVGYQEGKEVYTGGLPVELQYLWVRYEPTIDYFDNYPIDFTWEREWRFKCNGVHLPIYLNGYDNIFKKMPVGALIVERDEQVDGLRKYLASKAAQGITWAVMLTKSSPSKPWNECLMLATNDMLALRHIQISLSK